MNDEHPAYQEVLRAVKKGAIKWTGSASKMMMEDLEIWPKGMENKVKAQKKDKEGYDGTGDTCHMLLKLMQNIWNTGEILCQLLLTIVVLVLKGNTDKY